MEQIAEAYVNTEKAVLGRWPWLVAVKWATDSIGLPILLVLFGMGVWVGWVPSPFLDMAKVMVEHNQQTTQIVELLVANQREIRANQMTLQRLLPAK